MNYEIKKIDWLTLGIFSGIFVSLISLVPMFFGLMAFMSRVFRHGFSLEILAFLFFPLGSFVGGFVTGSLFALVYNLIAKHWQGVKMNIEYNEQHIKTLKH